MTVVFLLLLVASAICFATAAFTGRPIAVNRVALGLLCWVLVPLIQTAQALLA